MPNPVDAQPSESATEKNASRTRTARNKKKQEQAPVQIVGSRLLTPSSFYLTIPTATVSPTDWETVETLNEFGNSVIAKVHVKVGENYVVMLPNGNLVGRMADQVTRSDKSFKAASHKDIALQFRRNQLANFSNMRFDKSRNYVYLYNTSERFKGVTKGILESMLKGVKKYCENNGIETKVCDTPLIVIMFRTDAQFQAFRTMPGDVVAYYDMVSNVVVLREESPLSDERPDLVKSQLLSTIAHEGAHQVLHNIGVQQRLSLWPMWLSEGLAEYFAPTSIGKRNRWKGAGDVNDLRMFEMETFLQQRYIQGFDGKILNDIVTTQKLDSTGYATAWSVVHYLAKKHDKQFHKYISQLSHLGPMTGMAARPEDPVLANLEHFKVFFGDDLESEEKAWVDYLTKLEYESPMADYIHYVGMAKVPKDGGGEKRLSCFFHTEDRVDDWKKVLADSLSPEQIGGVQWEVREVNSRRDALKLMEKFRKGRR